MKSIFKNIFFVGAFLILAASCSNEEDVQLPDPDAGREKSVVDITLSLSGGWDIDDDETRAAPPTNVGDFNSNSFEDLAEVDSVRVVTFRRKEEIGGEFYYDMQNDMTLPVVEGSTKDAKEEPYSTHEHRYAEGKLTKTYGYEYRVVAIAYASKRVSSFSGVYGSVTNGEQNWMKIKDKKDDLPHTYSDFCAELQKTNCEDWTDFIGKDGLGRPINTKHVNPEILDTPQLFYGTLHSKKSNSDIISYAEEDSQGNMDSKVSLTGVLKRGVAKVEINIIPENEVTGLWPSTQTYAIEWITVMASTPNTKVGLSSYDDFLNPTREENGEKETYTVIAYANAKGFPELNPNKPIPIKLWMLPCKTKLAIRVKTMYTNGLGMQTISLRNGRLEGDANESHGDNGTGIVSPNFVDNEFYFRRNHRYVINVGGTETVLKNKLD